MCVGGGGLYIGNAGGGDLFTYTAGGRGGELCGNAGGERVGQTMQLSGGGSGNL